MRQKGVNSSIETLVKSTGYLDEDVDVEVVMLDTTGIVPVCKSILKASNTVTLFRSVEIDVCHAKALKMKLIHAN